MPRGHLQQRPDREVAEDLAQQGMPVETRRPVEAEVAAAAEHRHVPRGVGPTPRPVEDVVAVALPPDDAAARLAAHLPLRVLAGDREEHRREYYYDEYDGGRMTMAITETPLTLKKAFRYLNFVMPFQ